MIYSLDWPYAYGKPQATACFKMVPEDFQVNEFFTTRFSGEGEHILLRIEKRGLTTEDVARSLARLLNKPLKHISYAGLKDKQALTTQWFSIHAPGESLVGVGELAAPGCHVLEHTRHTKKLKPGFLSGNHFKIRLRHVVKEKALLQRIGQVKKMGVPNYFGEQRFGRHGANLIRAEEMLVQGQKVKDRFLKGMYGSAARSWLFNLILARRVQEGSWNVPKVGDVMQLSGSKSIFLAEIADDLLLQRVKDRDLSPASPLPGISKHLTQNKLSALIQEIYTEWMPWLNGLEQQGFEEGWRANILHVEQLVYNKEHNMQTLSFSLPAGAYATVVLRELFLEPLDL